MQDAVPPAPVFGEGGGWFVSTSPVLCRQPVLLLEFQHPLSSSQLNQNTCISRCVYVIPSFFFYPENIPWVSRERGGEPQRSSCLLRWPMVIFSPREVLLLVESFPPHKWALASLLTSHADILGCGSVRCRRRYWVMRSIRKGKRATCRVWKGRWV